MLPTGWESRAGQGCERRITGEEGKVYSSEDKGDLLMNLGAEFPKIKQQG